jgi:hypothetical protein
MATAKQCESCGRDLTSAVAPTSYDLVCLSCGEEQRHVREPDSAGSRRTDVAPRRHLRLREDDDLLRAA